MAGPELIRGACPHDCPDTCAWTVTVTDGRATALSGDPGHSFTRGGLCAKVNHYLERVYHPDRVLYPLRRTGPKGSGEFERVSWDDALDEAASRLRAVVDEDGPEAVLPYSYAGTMGVVQSSSMDRRFFGRLGASRLVRNICGSASAAGVAATLGTHLGMIPEDLVHSRFIILWGTNPVVTNLHLWPYIRRARADGATVVLVDPLRTRTAERADWHVQPRPGTDAALALAMMHVIVAEGRHDADYVARHTHGFDDLRERLAEYPPEAAAELCGVDAEEIRALARAYASTRPAAIRTLIGMEHHANGAMTLRTVACLPALVGAWRDLGGGLAHMTSAPFNESLNRAGVEMPELGRSARKINMVQLGRALTDSDLDPPVRALFVYNSNPATIAPNQNLVLAGLRRDDLFTVVLEQFLTDTARHADLVFPATTQVEHLDLHWSWGHTYLTLNRPAIAPLGEAAPNTEFFRRLAARLGMDEPYLHASDEELVRTALDSDHPYLRGISYERLLEQGWAKLELPSPWIPFADGAFPTPSGKCEFRSARMRAAGMDPLPAYVPPPGRRRASGGGAEDTAGGAASRYPLALLTAKSGLHFLNSSYAGLERNLRAEREPVLVIHPADAEPRGIGDGDMVRVHNDRGQVTMRARIGEQVRPGVVAMPFGWWASRSPGGSAANALTPDGLSDLGGGGDWYDATVEVQPADGHATGDQTAARFVSASSSAGVTGTS